MRKRRKIGRGKEGRVRGGNEKEEKDRKGKGKGRKGKGKGRKGKVG